jgi:translation initiation factor 2 beta subunit (eIF-2beta)/eIF-5
VHICIGDWYGHLVKASLTSVGRDLDFQHLPDVTVKNTHSRRKPMPVPSGSRKRKNTFEDSFSDIEIDDLDLDEDDLKQLERIESPNKLPNGNYKCNHRCKDPTK